MATKKKVATKKAANKKKIAKGKEDSAPHKGAPKLPRPVKCEGPVERERDGVLETVYFLPETDIVVPEAMKDHVYHIDDVYVDPTNPRITKNLDPLIAGIRRFGFRNPMIVNANNLEIEAGHKRREALKRLSCNYAPMIFVKDDQMRQTAFNLSDNRSSEIVADWDEEGLSKLYGQLRENDALEGVGFDDDSMIDVISRLREDERQQRNSLGDGGGGDEGEGGGEGGGGGGGNGGPIDDQYLITIKCESEKHQVELLEFLDKHDIDASASII